MAKWKIYGFPGKIIYTWWFIMVYHGLSWFIHIYVIPLPWGMSISRCFFPERKAWLWQFSGVSAPPGRFASSTHCCFEWRFSPYQQQGPEGNNGKWHALDVLKRSKGTTKWWFLLGKSTGKRVFPLKPIGSSYTDDCISLSIYSIYKYLYLYL